MSIYLTMVVWIAFVITLLDWLADEEFPGPVKVLLNLVLASFFPVMLLYIIYSFLGGEGEE